MRLKETVKKTAQEFAEQHNLSPDQVRDLAKKQIREKVIVVALIVLAFVVGFWIGR